MRVLWVAALGLIVLSAGCVAADDRARLHTLIADEWAFRLREDPLLATAVGVHDYDDRLPAVSAEAEARRAAARREFVARLVAIQRDRLGPDDRVNYDMLGRELRDALEAFEFRAYEIPITVDNGFHIQFARLPDQVPLATVQDYENYIARLRAFPAHVSEHVSVMRAGLARGFTLARVVLEGYDVTIASHVVDDPARSVFYRPFERFPASVATPEHVRLREAGRAAITDAVVPGYRSFLDFMTREYLAGARTTIGASDLPNGRDYYRYLIRYWTTLDATPEAIHQTGLDEVRRIRAEMADVLARIGYRGDFASFLRFLRTDPRFYAATPEALLKEAAFIAKRMDGKLPALFGTLPRRPYGVAPVPDHLAPKYTGGRYVAAPIGSTQPGYYWVNTYALNSRPLYVLTALTLHEAVPGHHLQIALSQELEGVPPFRRFADIGAFQEGWGLYAERLGVEAGMYADPYDDFGRLTYEMWRACRLVVDTGMHALGWGRRQAMDFLAANTALSLHEVRTETDRYISWPGQALAYKIGELMIRQLRARAEAALGPQFDVRTFHDAVLLNGPVPLPVLEQQVADYIAAAGGREPAP